MEILRINEPVTVITFPDNKEQIEKNVTEIKVPSYSEKAFLFVVESYPDHITGGRYHIFEYALALCYIGYKVVWLTNCRPLYIDSFRNYNLRNLTIVIRNGYPTPTIFNDNYVFKNIVGTPLGCIDQVEYYKRVYSARGVKYYQIVLVCPPLARQFRGGVDVDDSGTGYQRSIESMKNADYILTQTNLNKKEISKWLDFPENKIKVIPPAVNNLVAQKYLNREQKHQIIYISRFVSYKHPEMILKVAKDLQYDGKIIMIGGAGGLAYETLRRMAQKNNLNLEIIPYCDDDKKFRLISESELMLFPSDWEDFGMPLLEAGYYGVPTITFDNPTFREVYGNYLIYAKRKSYEDYLNKVKEALKRKQRNYDLQFYVMHNYLFERMITRMKSMLSNQKVERLIPRLLSTEKLKIGMLKAGGVGDALEGLKIAKKIREKYFDAHITFYVRDDMQRELFEIFPGIADEVIPTYGERWGTIARKVIPLFDIFYDLTYVPKAFYNCDKQRQEKYEQKYRSKGYEQLYQNWRTSSSYLVKRKMRRIQLLAEVLQIELNEEDEFLPLKDDNQILSNQRYVVFHHGADGGYRTKTWLKERWDAVINYVKNKGYKTVQLGTEKEELLDVDVDLRGKTTLRDVFIILRDAQLLCDTEGGLAHIAHTQKTKSLVLFGPTPVTAYGYVDNINIVKNCCKFQPCWWQNPYWNNRCYLTKQKPGKCMLQITIDDVIEELKKIL